MMSEDIHKWSDGRYTLMFDEHTFFVFDNEKEERITALETTKRLNEQQAIIRRDETSIKTMMSNMKKLEEENEQLRKELNDFKPVMFQDVRKGTVILYSKGGIDE